MIAARTPGRRPGGGHHVTSDPVADPGPCAISQRRSSRSTRLTQVSGGHISVGSCTSMPGPHRTAWRHRNTSNGRWRASLFGEPKSSDRPCGTRSPEEPGQAQFLYTLSAAFTGTRASNKGVARLTPLEVRRLDRRAESTTAPVSVQSQKLGPELRVKSDGRRVRDSTSVGRLGPFPSGEHPRAIRPSFTVWRDVAGRGSAGRPRGPCKAL